MNEKQIAKWKNARLRGKNYFIWKNGVFYFGVSVAILSSLSKCLPLVDKSFMSHLKVNLIIGPIMGYLWGLGMWYICEKQYQKALKKLLNS